MNSAFISRMTASVVAGLGAFSAYPADQPPLPNLGQTFSGTIRAKYPVGNTTMKGVVVTLGNKAYVCYDTDLMRVSMGWTGDFLKFGNYQREVVHPQPPEVAGKIAFGCKPAPGW